MADPIRLKIIDEFVNRMGDAALYSTVFDFEETDRTERTGVIDTDEEPAAIYAGKAIPLQITVEKLVPIYDAAGNYDAAITTAFNTKKGRAPYNNDELRFFAKVTIGNQKYAEIIQAIIATDRTLGGLAQDTAHIGGGPDYTADPAFVAVRAFFQVTYETELADPYTVLT